MRPARMSTLLSASTTVSSLIDYVQPLQLGEYQYNFSHLVPED